jgi:hypothetical protein
MMTYAEADETQVKDLRGNTGAGETGESSTIWMTRLVRSNPLRR